MKINTALYISFRLWMGAALALSLPLIVYISLESGSPFFAGIILAPIAGIIGGLPAFIALWIVLPQIKKSSVSAANRVGLLTGCLLLIALGYSIAPIVVLHFPHFHFTSERLWTLATELWPIFPVLCLSILTSVCFCRKSLLHYLDADSFFQQRFFSTSKHHTMEPIINSPAVPQAPAGNNIMLKGFITGALILLLLVPTIFISNLVNEREARQQEIVKEVSSKWATEQALSSPFLVVPYSYTYQAQDDKTALQNTHLILLPDSVNVGGQIHPQVRQRSIYKVLLYQSQISFAGNFKLQLPADINADQIDFSKAKLCFTLSDYKGIEEDIYVEFNNQKLPLRPGLPLHDFGKTGLSVPLALSIEQLQAGMPFSMNVKIKGSGQLHFIPMSNSSTYTLSSAWNDPSFDGETLPSSRTVSSNGFNAQWKFNQANLPFASAMEAKTVPDRKMAFGVSLVEPANQYAQTMRSVKYAILIIGLSFAFFFIIELMQKKPFHPVQYTLVGIALIIFYTLLLSLSEYISFDLAYLSAALAVIVLISVYAQAHFKNIKTAGIFFTLLSLLYGFIFVLVRLEDTALLVGSIGLFVILALCMYASRKINWYGNAVGDKNVPSAM